jgi:hypothetical protein
VSQPVESQEEAAETADSTAKTTVTEASVSSDVVEAKTEDKAQ